MCPQHLGGETCQVSLNLAEFLGLDLSASLAGGEGTVLHTILELYALGVGPGDVIAEALPIRLEVSFDVVSKCCACNLGLNRRVNLGLDGVSCHLPLRAVLIIESQHVVIGPTIHLNWEDRGLEGQSGPRTLR